MTRFCKKPCKHCPFRNDITPFLHPDRAADIAYSAENRYSDFPCHKTTEYDEEIDDGSMICNDKSKTCAGFLTLRAQSGLVTPDGFNPSWDICYTNPFEMYQAYDEEYNKHKL